MSEDNERVDEPPRQAPRRRDDSEKGLGLEMARLFGMNPKVMMAPKAPVQPSEDGEPDLVADSDPAPDHDA